MQTSIYYESASELDARHRTRELAPPALSLLLHTLQAELQKNVVA